MSKLRFLRAFAAHAVTTWRVLREHRKLEHDACGPAFTAAFRIVLDAYDANNTRRARC